MNRGQVLIAAAIVLLAGVIWLVFGKESCASWQKRETKAFAESLYGGPQADAEFYRIRAERPDCRS